MISAAWLIHMHELCLLVILKLLVVSVSFEHVLMDMPSDMSFFVPELASGQIDPLLPELVAGPSSSSSLSVEELEANLGVGELSRQSSHTSLSDPLSPSIHDFSDEESDISSDLEVN